MDRNEAILRELNLYPLWQRRNVSAITEQPETFTPANSTAESKTENQPPTGCMMESAPDITGKPKPCTPSILPKNNLADLGWPELKKMVRDCTACGLRAGCTQTVFGTGDEKAEWLFVGEGPGADEDALGEPFVGQAGQLLDNMLLSINLKRGKNVYIANIVKCRPPGNRTPSTEEILHCLPYLQRQIELIQPRLIVALGKTAATALLHMAGTAGPAEKQEHEITLSSLRGTRHHYQGIPLIITYHPAYLLRRPLEKSKAWQDLCLATRTIHESPRSGNTPAV